MDPLTAFSVAGTVLQIIQLGSQIVSKGYKIHKSNEGALSENLDLEAAARNLRRMTTTLNDSLNNAENGPPTEESEIFQEICSDCTSTANRLIDRLDGLKVHGASHRRWKSFRQALKSSLGKNGVDEMAKSLSLSRSQLEIHILVSLRKQQNLLLIQKDDQFDKLDKATQFIIASLSEFRSKFETEFDKHIKEINAMAGQDINRDPNLKSIKSLVDTVTKILKDAHSSGSILSGAHDGDLDQISITATDDSAKLPTPQFLSSMRLGNYTLGGLAEKGMLKSLKFATMEERCDEISEAHCKTFEWIFRPPEVQCRRWDSFSSWLATGNGIYWINGKAASGKSTLMKFVCENEKTRQLLKEWAGTTRLNIASFFFWNSGTTEQRSHKGLLKSLLHQVLSHQPELIPYILPKKWNKGSQTISNSTAVIHRSDIMDFDEIWTLPKLKEAFTLLCSQTAVPTNLCYFIDGLDEYDDDCTEMAQLLQHIAALPNVKVCVSSRPWLIFEEAFENDPALRLQDLTNGDITRFVRDRLQCNHRWTSIAKQNSTAASELVNEIVDKSDGVFLWVSLVVKSLLNGLQNHDSLSDLRERLGLLPTDLKRLYMHMLETIQPHFYLAEASRIFQIVRKARETREFLKCNKLPESNPLTVVELAFARDYDHDAEQQIRENDQDCQHEMLLISQRMAGVLKTRCAGLLELGEGATANSEPSTHLLSSGKDCRSPLQAVVYLHRTARDFLEQGDNWTTITRHNMDADFNPCTALLRSCVKFLIVVNKLEAPVPCMSYLSDWTGRPPQSDRKWSAIFQALQYAYWIDFDTGDPQEALLDKLDEVVTSQHTVCKSASEHWSTHSPLNLPLRHDGWKDSFLSNAIQYGLYSYVRCKLAKDPSILENKAGMPLLDYAMYPSTSNIEYARRREIVGLLLEYGASPNKIFMKQTSWQQALYYASQDQSPGTPNQGVWLSIITDLASHGANPQAQCNTGLAVEVVERLFAKSDPVAAANLRRLLGKPVSQTKSLDPDVQIMEDAQRTQAVKNTHAMQNVPDAKRMHKTKNKWYTPLIPLCSLAGLWRSKRPKISAKD